MKKPRIAVCFLALAMTVWAVHPMALAIEFNWLSPGETAPEPEAKTVTIDESVWASPNDTASGSRTEGTPEREEAASQHWLDTNEAREVQDETPEDDGKWLNPGETPVEQVPEPEEGPKWLNPGEVPVEQEPEPEKEKWLTPDDALNYVEEPEPEPEDAPEWLTPDALTDVVEEPEPEQPEEEEEWLTQEKSPEPEDPEPEETKPEGSDPEDPEPEKTPKPELAGGALIEVTVPVSGDMVINPHHLPVNLGGKVIRDQLINTPQLLTNRSDVPIVVTASVTVNTGETSGIKVTDRPIGAGETDKLAYLYVEFQNVADSATDASWSGGYTGASNQLLAKGSGTVSGDVLRVEAGDTIPAYASYRVFGSLTENPKSGWKTGDKLSVTVSFTFRPAEEPEQDEEPETAEEPVEAEAEPVEAAVKPEEKTENKAKADAKPEEVPEAAEEPKPEPDPGPEPEPAWLEASAYEPAAVFEREEEPEEKPKSKTDGLDSFASGSNPDWMRPPE